MLRRTKILATLGPATDRPGVVDGLIRAGVDVVRLNLSHGTHQQHRQRIEVIRERADARDCPIGVLVDLQGPKIRIGGFKAGPVTLNDGDRFVLDADCPLDGGDSSRVGFSYRQLVDDLSPGDTLLLADGAVELSVDEVQGNQVICRVVSGDQLSDNKGINRKGGGISAPALTDKDKQDIAFAAEIDADYLAVSFVRGAGDVAEARRLLEADGGRADIVSKIERAEAVAAIDEAIAMAAMYTANHLPVAAIAALTESGSTPKWMSRISSAIPIYALSSHVSTRRKVTLYRGVYPLSFELQVRDSQQANEEIAQELQRWGAVREGDLIIITKGDLEGVKGGTNVMKIFRVGGYPLARGATTGSNNDQTVSV